MTDFESLDFYINKIYTVESLDNSMSPRINHGDIVYCQPDSNISNGDIVHYCINGESGIKVYEVNESNTTISLVPLNNSFKTITLEYFENIDFEIAKVIARVNKYI